MVIATFTSGETTQIGYKGLTLKRYPEQLIQKSFIKTPKNLRIGFYLY